MFGGHWWVAHIRLIDGLCFADTKSAVEPGVRGQVANEDEGGDPTHKVKVGRHPGLQALVSEMPKT